ncbi:amidase [Actinocatenispora sera]|uniref:Amidase n=1 Tax=Actinocatenispora sera TaxID=390989 RepID=A0A810L159_9ACTN|nr:amidase family protein [Actinocatenispora sera]BCJ28635.1 amidase [Actinocatenispora sera]
MSDQPEGAARSAGTFGANDDLCLLSMRQQSALIRSREISATELITAHLHRIAAVDPAVHAVVSVDEERALAEAAAADAALARGEPCGPLHGLPAAVKDVHDVAGLRTTYGSALYASNVAEHDDPVVARIRAAGAIVLGKTNVSEFGFGAHTRNALFESTSNPYAPARAAGGSCGGTAAALATGMATVCEGSDLAGSLRNPASFCNVVGLRPAAGRVPNARSGFGWQPLSVTGPMGRTVDDVGLLLSIMAGPHPAMPLALDADPAKFARIDPADLTGVRVALAPDLAGTVAVDRQVRAVVASQASILAELGCIVEDACIDFDGADEAFRTLRSWTLAYLLDDTIRRHRESLPPSLVQNIEEGQWLSGRDIASALETQARLHERAAVFFDRYDLLVTAAAATPPFPIEQEFPPTIDGAAQTSHLDWLRIAYAISMTGCPALALPAGFTPTGLPVGVQLVGPHREERRLLAIGRAFERANAAGRRRPDLAGLARRGLSLIVNPD